jgi:hypothetical protein
MPDLCPFIFICSTLNLTTLNETENIQHSTKTTKQKNELTIVMEDIMTNENENEKNDNILIIEAGDRPELYPHVVLKGNSANLSALRGTDAQTRSIFFDERNNSNDEDTPSTPPLLMESSVFVSLMTTDADADDEHENDNENENNNNAVIKGEMFITNTQILFVAIERDQSEYDLAIGAACIVLHAMTDEPELSIYLQLSSSSSVGEQQQQPPTEVTLTPIHNENDNDCQKIFDALCKLISLNPIEPDDDDDGGGGGNMMDGMFGFRGTGTGGFGDDNDGDGDVDDDGFIWAPTTASSKKTSDGTATTLEEEERDAMLERLDNLLVVPPQFEDGQFDDAIEENDE